MGICDTLFARLEWGLNAIMHKCVISQVKQSFLALVFLPLFQSSLLSSPPVSVDVPLDHWSYPILNRFVVRGLVDVRGLTTLPLNRIQMADIAQEVIVNLRAYDVGKKSWKYTEALEEDLDKIVEEFRNELVAIGEKTLEGKKSLSESEVRLVYPFRLERVFADLNDNDSILMHNRNGWVLEKGGNLRFSVRSWAKFKNRLAVAIKPVYIHNKADKDLTLEEGYVRANWGAIEFSIGRSSMWWGAGKFGSLILSHNAAPLDTFKVRNVHPMKLSGRWSVIGAVDWMYFISRLKSSRNVPRAKLTGVRVTVAPHSDFVFGLSKTVILGGERSGSDLNIGDIFKAFVKTNENEVNKSNNNQIMMIDATWRIQNTNRWLPFTNNALVYGQFATDGEEDSGLSNPAYLVGMHWLDIFCPGVSFRAEYASTKKEDDRLLWYSHPLYRSGYKHKNQNLGHFMGGDADSFFLRVEKQGFINLQHTIGFQFDRVRSLLSSANTEVRTRYSIDVEMFRSSFVEAKFQYTLEHIKNYLRVEDSKSTNHMIEISGRAEF